MSNFRSIMDRLPLLLSLVCSAILSSTLSKDPEPQCTPSHMGLPACNFNSRNCFYEVKGDDETPAWRLVKEDTAGPVKPYEKAYVFLDWEKSKGKPRSMQAFITENSTALCVEYYFATSGNTSAPINFYLKEGESDFLMHRVQDKTNGSWYRREFFCCLPDVHKSRRIVIEAASAPGSEVALDYIDVRHSNMVCDNDRLTCYPQLPGQAPLGPDDRAPLCPVYAGEIDPLLSCDFNTEDVDKPDFCSWRASAGWEARQKRDGSGVYDVIYTSEGNEGFLVNDLPDNVTYLCVEIQFTADRIVSASLTGVFTIYIGEAYDENKTTTIIWGQAYSYEASKQYVWIRNYFSRPLAPGRNRQITLVPNTDGLRVDYIHLRTKASQSSTVGNISDALSVSPPSPSLLFPVSTDSPDPEGTVTEQEENVNDFTTLVISGVGGIISILFVAAVLWVFIKGCDDKAKKYDLAEETCLPELSTLPSSPSSTPHFFENAAYVEKE